MGHKESKTLNKHKKEKNNLDVKTKQDEGGDATLEEGAKIKTEINSKTNQKEISQLNNINNTTTDKLSTSETVNIHLEKINKKTLKSTGGSLNTDIRKIYKFKEVLGGGHFGTVRVGYRRDEDSKKIYAIKSISKKELSKRDLEDLMKEVEILSSLDHPNIIHFYETYHDESYFHIVMELCTGKEVFDKIIEEGTINEHKVAIIIYKLLHAIRYCHAAGITHRDLKPENILFETADPDAEIKLIDFGLSRKYDRSEKMHTILGTPYYVSPEVLKGEYDEKCDVWSIGALAYIMLSGEPAFNGNSNNEIFNKILQDELQFNKEKWKNISKEAKDFVKKCMIKKPELRFSTLNSIEHPWFSNIQKELYSGNNFNPEILENLRNFESPQKFKKMVLKFLVNQLSHDEIKNLKKAFYAIDQSHEGFIDKGELERAFELAKISISQEELQKIIDSADDMGRLDYSEFLIASLNQKKFIDKEKLVSAFKYFDIDDSGYIDSSDLKNVLLRSGKNVLNVNELDKILEEVSQQQQQKLSFSEFLKIFGYDL